MSERSLRALELRVLRGEREDGDPSYDRGLFDGLQAMFSLCVSFLLDNEALKKAFLYGFQELPEMTPESRIWDLVLEPGTGETLGQYHDRILWPEPETEEEF
jgi:hypothetical protein